MMLSRSVSSGARKKLISIVGVGLIVASTLVVQGLTDHGAANSAPVAQGVEGGTHTGTVSGHLVTAPVSSTPIVPSAAEVKARDHAFALEQSLKAPKSPRATTRADANSTSPGPQTSGTSAQTAAAPDTNPAPTAFHIFTNKTIPSECASDCGQSTVNEPSAVSAGKETLETSNWDIADSSNNGGTWSYQDPYTLFGSGFCCDTEVRYAANQDKFVWSGTYAPGNSTNRVEIALASSKTPTSWCAYSLLPTAFGGTLGDIMDYPKIALGNNDLYLTWNEYNSGGSFLWTGLARLDLNAMTTCSSVGYSYLTRTDVFTFDLAGTGAKDTFYWTANWYLSGGTSGSQVDIFTWAENSGSYFTNQVNINPYNFSIAACSWCGRLDPRSVSVAISRGGEFRGFGDDFLEMAIDAGPSSFDAHNYVVYEYFQLHSLTYEGSDQSWNGGVDIGYPSCASNAEGYVGCAMTFGGANDVPGGLIVLQDNTSPTQPWANQTEANGIANPSGEAWGDYVVVNPLQPASGPFETVLWNVNGAGVVTPHFVIFGRYHDLGGYTRWGSA
jgi:hypothetical protein